MTAEARASHSITAGEYARIMAEHYEPSLDWDNPDEIDLLDRDELVKTATKILARLAWRGFVVQRLDDLALDEFDVTPDRAEWQAAQQPETMDAETWHFAIAAERERQIEAGYTQEHDDAHGIDHLHTWALDYARRGKLIEVGALIEAAREVRFREQYRAAQQSETRVTDEMVNRLLFKYDNDPSFGVKEFRAALVAALDAVSRIRGEA